MIFVKLCMFCVLLSISAGDDHLQPGLIQEYYNVFNNLSKLALMPDLMETPDCRRDCEIYRQAFYQNQMWAAEMFDANGRQSLGILKGNKHQFGSMHQCVSSSSETSNIEGKFCFIQIYLKPLANNKFMNEIWQNAFNLTVLTSKPYQRTVAPSSETILSALCIPSSCTAREVLTASRKVLSIFNQTTFGFEVHVDDLTERNCAVKRELYSNHQIVYLAKTFIFAMIILVFCATLCHNFISQDVRNNRNLMAIFSKSFSLQQNYRTLTSVENNNDSISCLNGFRCLTYFLLFLLHYNLKFWMMVVDRSDNFTPFLQNPFMSTLVKNSPCALDCLIFSSGITHSYKITKFLKRNDTKAILKSMLYKYLRFCTFWVIFIAIQSKSVHKSALHLLYTPVESKTSIWRILLCIENFYGIQNMYFAPAHSFYTDIQLYFISCIVLLLTRRYINKTKLLFFIAFGSLFCRSLFVYFNPEVPSFFRMGISVNQICDLFTFMFATPFSRLPFYVSGVALGYHLGENPNLNITISSLNRKIGGWVAFFCTCIAIFSYYWMDDNYKYNSFDGAVVSFINSFCWLIFGIWIVWYCEVIGKSSGVKRFLAADTFVILNRLTPYFSALHLFVLYNSLINTRFLFEFKFGEILGLDYLFLTILACAFVMLFIYLPLKNTWDNVINKKGVNKTDTDIITLKHE